LQDPSCLVQGSLQLRFPQDPAGATRKAISALDPFTVVHATNLHRLPLASGPAWGLDTAKSFGGVLISDGPKKESFGAIGGSDALRGTSHGVYGAASVELPGKPLFSGAWQSSPSGAQVSHAQPSADGGLDVTSSEHQLGSLAPGSGIREILAPLNGAAGSAPGVATRGAEGEVKELAERPQEQRLAEIVKQPFSADTLTVAFRKQGSDKKGPGWGKDDVLAAGGQLLSTDDVKGGLGGVGGLSLQDQSYHLLYGSGLWLQKLSKPPTGSSLGFLAGKPGQMDLTHLQPTADGGADVMRVRARTEHASREEFQKLLESGNFSLWPPPPQASSTLPPAPSSTSTRASSTSAAPSSTSSPEASSTLAAPSSTSTSVVPAASTAPASGAGGATTAQPSFAPGSQEEAWQRITERVGDISEGLQEGQLPPLLPESWATSAAAQLSANLVSALGPVKLDAEALLNDTLRVKADVFEALNLSSSRPRGKSSSAPVPATQALETTFYRGVADVLGKWRRFQATLGNVTANLTRGLRAAGQVGLAERLERSSNASAQAIQAFVERVGEAVEKVPGTGQLEAQQAELVLEKTNAGLYEALRALSGLGQAKLGKPVQDLVDRLADTLSTSGASPERVQRSLGAVEHLTTAVQWRVRGAGRELVLAGHQAVAAVAERLDLPPPGWPPKGAEPVGPEGLDGEADAGNWWSSWFSGAVRGPGASLQLLLSLALFATVA